MVRLSYQKDIDETYAQVRESACGRQACTVLILIANEVSGSGEENSVVKKKKTNGETFNNTNTRF